MQIKQKQVVGFLFDHLKELEAARTLPAAWNNEHVCAYTLCVYAQRGTVLLCISTTHAGALMCGGMILEGVGQEGLLHAGFSASLHGPTACGHDYYSGPKVKTNL